MLSFIQLTILSCLSLFAYGYNPNDEVPSHLSLPNLLTISSQSDLDSNWELYDNIRLDTGRLLIGTGGGSIWSIPGLENSGNEWTIELVVRSSGTAKRDLKFRDQNHLALWLTTDKVTNNAFGGGNFDGFQIALSNKNTQGLKVFSNDNSKFIDGSVAQSVGSCDFPFLDSSIPFTIRVSYSKTRGNWFKVQVDNNVCFKTYTMTIPNGPDDLRFGVTGKIATASEEEYEILKLNVWTHLTEDAIDDHGFLGDGALAEVAPQKEEVDHIRPSQIRESLMQKTRKAKQEMEEKQAYESRLQNGGRFEETLNSLSSQIDAIINKIDGVGKQQPTVISSTSSTYDSKVIHAHLEEIKTTQSQQGHALQSVRDDIVDFKSTLTQQLSQLLSALQKLNERVIGEVREQQYGMEELSKKVDLLMANHKEVAYQYQQGLKGGQEGEDFLDKFISKIKWILIPLCIGFMLITGFLYRLRSEIKHAKLL
ncbi:protein Emp47p [[Candida] railenensis]|uniref:Protein Emp47p n=1 Tax=[Candida] railenensis TaxID=45579 RepID=A0A9P0QNG1_9ASCO|nr:protein Emp47p [[Candida] railenensis]